MPTTRGSRPCTYGDAADGPEGAASNAQAVEGGHGRSRVLARRHRVSGLSSAGGRRRRRAHLRSIAVLYTNAVHLLVRRASGITRGADMRGHRVQMADDAGGGTGGADAPGRRRLRVERARCAEPLATRAMRSRASSPISSTSASSRPRIRSPPIEDVGPSSQIALLSLEPEVIDRLRSRFPFFKPAVIPKGTYQRPGRRRPDRRHRRPAALSRLDAGIDGLRADAHAVRSAARSRARRTARRGSSTR